MRIDACESEDPRTGFARDQLMMLRSADDQLARARVWRRRGEGVQLGRFHRVDPASIAWPAAEAHIGEDSGALSRRLSGGRIVPVGAGVVCITLVVPLVDWLDPAGKSLRPEQVLNRALRPLLAMLRGEGVEAFYPGRDLVTAKGKTVAHASFTVQRDGVAMVEMQIAEREGSFAGLAGLLERFDPQGIAAVDREALAGATSVEESGGAARRAAEWAERFAGFAGRAFGCEAECLHEADDGVTSAHASAAHAFTSMPGPARDGMLAAATVAMLGVVECSGRLVGNRLRDLEVTGDLIAPFHTVDAIGAECEGEPFRAANIRKALARVMAQPRSFLLGLRELDELILRLG